MYNYARFTTILNFKLFLNLKRIVVDDKIDKIGCLEKGLLDFILDHSTPIKKFVLGYSKREWIVKHQKFDFCFQHLYELKLDYDITRSRLWNLDTFLISWNN